MSRLLTNAEIAEGHRRICKERISEAAKEIILLGEELRDHPADITWEACDGIHTLLGKIEAAALILHGPVDDDEQLNAHERAHEAEQREIRRG